MVELGSEEIPCCMTIWQSDCETRSTSTSCSIGVNCGGFDCTVIPHPATVKGVNAGKDVRVAGPAKVMAGKLLVCANSTIAMSFNKLLGL
ncbi:Uncharacterised protein [Vibrio cholerae]|uniref:Uncharacterized protein n=1 Tax=Vibrio cholerae TaxID=666 RepID=A0A656AH98_VIBCL|nr:Uncharacterised protein [Vibrio cholerae]CSC69280.1 Uncharacterised protein [Vibrio cholerae]CSD10146.1 Uncharacterised protein [Vibrio cholerae]